jgi:hypothetical protein
MRTSNDTAVVRSVRWFLHSAKWSGGTIWPFEIRCFHKNTSGPSHEGGGDTFEFDVEIEIAITNSEKDTRTMSSLCYARKRLAERI